MAFLFWGGSVEEVEDGFVESGGSRDGSFGGSYERFEFGR